MACAILSGAVFLLLASVAAMPVSTTHAIVGAVLGVTVVGVGAACVRWQGLATIAASWLLSPVLAGLLSAFCFWTLRLCILQACPFSTGGTGALDIPASVSQHHRT